MLVFYTSMVKTSEEKDKVALIYENYYSFMCYTAGQVLKHNKYDVEDAVHSAMIKLIENLELIDFSDMKKVKNLCGIIARNKAIDHCKLKDNQSYPIDDEIVENIAADNEPSETMIRIETYDIILNSIRSLDDIYRDVCIMKYLHGLKEREIALLLDMNPKTVSTRIFRGKQILREALRKENIYV